MFMICACVDDHREWNFTLLTKIGAGFRGHKKNGNDQITETEDEKRVGSSLSDQLQHGIKHGLIERRKSWSLYLQTKKC
jgi:hypothetical protein